MGDMRHDEHVRAGNGSRAAKWSGMTSDREGGPDQSVCEMRNLEGGRSDLRVQQV